MHVLQAGTLAGEYLQQDIDHCGSKANPATIIIKPPPHPTPTWGKLLDTLLISNNLGIFHVHNQMHAGLLHLLLPSEGLDSETSFCTKLEPNKSTAPRQGWGYDHQTLDPHCANQSLVSQGIHSSVILPLNVLPGVFLAGELGWL